MTSSSSALPSTTQLVRKKASSRSTRNSDSLTKTLKALNLKSLMNTLCHWANYIGGCSLL